MYKIKYLDESSLDLQEIANFIGITLENSSYARKVIKNIKYKIRGLKESPERCAPYPFECNNPNFPSPHIYIYCRLFIGNYVAVYTIDKKLKLIIIVRIFYARSNY